jgi:hypothetical protein
MHNVQDTVFQTEKEQNNRKYEYRTLKKKVNMSRIREGSKQKRRQESIVPAVKGSFI